MPICAMYNCSSEYQRGSSVRLFGLPSVVKHLCDQTKELSSKRRELWLSRINREFGNREISAKAIKVCHKHFAKGSPSALFDTTNPDWAPSLNLGYGSGVQSTVQTMKSVVRHMRAKARHPKRYARKQLLPSTCSREEIMQIEDIGPEETPLSIVDNFDAVQEGERVVMSLDFGCQADMHVQEESELHTKCIDLFRQNCNLMERMLSLESHLAKCTLEKEKLQYERDSLSFDNIHLKQEISELRNVKAEKDFEGDSEKSMLHAGAVLH